MRKEDDTEGIMRNESELTGADTRQPDKRVLVEVRMRQEIYQFIKLLINEYQLSQHEVLDELLEFAYEHKADLPMRSRRRSEISKLDRPISIWASENRVAIIFAVMFLLGAVLSIAYIIFFLRNG